MTVTTNGNPVFCPLYKNHRLVHIKNNKINSRERIFPYGDKCPDCKHQWKNHNRNGCNLFNCMCDNANPTCKAIVLGLTISISRKNNRHRCVICKKIMTYRIHDGRNNVKCLLRCWECIQLKRTYHEPIKVSHSR